MRTDGRRFITVAIGMDSHPKIADLSDKAFRLLIETWLWCAEHGTDGVVKAARWNRSATPRARRELIENGLVCIANDHFVMHDFLEHQPSKSDRKQLSDDRARAASLGNHKRWHEARDKIDDECPLCDDDYRKRIALAIGLRSQTDRKPIAEVEVDKDRPTTPPMGAAPVGDAREKGPAPAGTGAANALRFVATRIGDHITPGTRTSLAFQIQKLHAQGVSDDDLAEALDRWDHRTGIGPAMLPNLVDDIRKEARGATSRAPVVGPAVNGTDAHFAALLATTNSGPQLRALPGGA